MKDNKLIYIAAFIVTISSPNFTVLASDKIDDSNFSHLMNSAAISDDANIMTSTSTYKIEVHVQGKSLAGLSIKIPD